MAGIRTGSDKADAKIDDKLRFSQVIIVEGRYDRIKLASIVDAVIIETGGFAVFKDNSRAEYIKKMAMLKGAIIFTDSDSAGLMIRNHIKSIAAGAKLWHAYLPDVYGKEKRKVKASKEGKLGVEGFEKQAIIKALQNAGVERSEIRAPMISKSLLYELSLSGRKDSAMLRAALLSKMRLPDNLSASALIQVLNAAEMTPQKLKEIMSDLTV